MYVHDNIVNIHLMYVYISIFVHVYTWLYMYSSVSISLESGVQCDVHCVSYVVSCAAGAPAMMSESSPMTRP